MKILVVGGGSAGWMAAAYLSVKGCEVTLIESSDIPIIGVGESTLPAMNLFCQELGLKEQEWMDQCYAIRKLGIDHRNWSAPGSHWWHWFIYDRTKQESHHDYLKSGTWPEQQRLEYGYHVDAIEFGQSIAKPIASKHKCQHIVDEIDQVVLTEDGSVDYVATKSGQQLRADYYIDCTGFAKVLSRAVGIEYEPYTDIINDRAIACPQKSLDQIKNYTLTYRKSAGWIWEIALTNRRGVGYVYSSKHISDEQAVKEYCEQFPDTDVSKIRYLKFTPEKCLNPFKKNVVAVGLAAGFIEPLEATSLWLTQYNIMNFYRVISKGLNPEVFNRAQRSVVDEIHLFILAHYTLVADDSNDYWRHFKEVEAKLNTRETVKKLANAPDTGKYQGTKLFFPYNWWSMLDGYGIAND